MKHNFLLSVLKMGSNLPRFDLILNLTLTLTLASAVLVPLKPGDPCDPLNAPCNGIPQTECKEGPDGDYRCMCDFELITDFVNGRCITKPQKPGDACAPGVPAALCDSIPDTECAKNEQGLDICKCIGDLVTLPGRCLMRPKFPGEECHVTLATCAAVANAATCAIKEEDVYFCKCDGDLVTDVLGKRCLVKPLKPGHPCHQTLTPCEGIALTTCQLVESGQFLCKCNDGFYTDVAGERCLKIPAYPGESCVPDMTPCAGVTNTTCELGNDGVNYFCKCKEDLVTDPGGQQCLIRPTHAGDSCHPSLTPCTGIENTNCGQDGAGERHYCKCTAGFVNDFEGRRCLKIPDAPGQECHPIAAPCIGVERTECNYHLASSKYICTCNVGLVTDIPNARCVSPPILPGDPCVVHLAPCTAVANTTCEIFPPYPSLCKCLEADFVTDLPGRRCVKIPKRPGQPCEPPYTDCALTSEPSSCEESDDGTHFYCKCSDPDLVTDPVAEICLRPPSMPGDSCHVSLTPCVGVANTTCQLNPDGNTYHCTCVPPFVTDSIRGRCLTQPARPGDPCDPMLTPCEAVPIANTTCSASGFDFTCECIGDLVTDPNHGICLPLPTKPGDLCHPTIATCDDIADTACVEDLDRQKYICNCTGELITDPVNGRCLEVPAFPGDLCDPLLAPCTIVNNTECVKKAENGDYFCMCNAGYITDEIGKRCIKIPTLPGDDCAVEVDLCPVSVVNTTCVDVEGDGKGAYCKCIPDFITEGGKCFNKPTAPGDTCGPEHAPCTGIPLTECKDDGSGSGFYCKCIDGYFNDFVYRACVPHPQKVGDQCDANNATTCSAASNTGCRPVAVGIHKCTCNGGYFQEDDECIAYPTRPLQRCMEQVHCDPIPHTECALPRIGAPHKLCLCLENFDPSQDGNRCIGKAQFVNDYCETFLQCTLLPNTNCERQEPSGETICACVFGTIENSAGKACLPIVTGLGQDCTEHIQCTEGIGPNAACDAESDTCDCKIGYVGNTHKNQCLKTANYREPCEEHAQCTAELGDESMCTADNECDCRVGAGYLNRRCYRQVRLNYPCTATEECILGVNEYAHCTRALPDSVCDCLPDAIEWNRHCYANLSIGSPCTSNPECFVPVPESSCQNSTCVCDNGRQPGAGAKTCSAGIHFISWHILLVFLGLSIWPKISY